MADDSGGTVEAITVRASESGSGHHVAVYRGRTLMWAWGMNLEPEPPHGEPYVVQALCREIFRLRAEIRAQLGRDD